MRSRNILILEAAEQMLTPECEFFHIVASTALDCGRRQLYRTLSTRIFRRFGESKGSFESDVDARFEIWSDFCDERVRLHT